MNNSIIKSHFYNALIKYYKTEFNLQMKKKLEDLKTKIVSDDINFTNEEKDNILSLISIEENKYIKKTKKIENKILIDECDFEHYIQTILINIDGREFLQDENGFLYENNDENTIIGMIKEDEILYFN